MELNIVSVNPWHVVKVSFQTQLNADGKLYEYRTRIVFMPGDAAVVEVNGILKVVTVIEPLVDKQEFRGELKWIVSKVDTEGYINTLKEEKAIEDELMELERLAAAAKKVKQVKEAFTDDPALLARLNKVIERKRNL